MFSLVYDSQWLDGVLLLDRRDLVRFNNAFASGQFPHQRYGQAFINAFGFAAGLHVTPLFYERSSTAAKAKIANLEAAGLLLFV